MQPLRRWNPADVRPGSGQQACVAGASASPMQASDRDVAFCAEFAVHGGVATYNRAFNPGVDLLRMEAAGLLDLVREPGPNLAVVRVSLSPAARHLLSGVRAAATPAQPPIAADGSRRNGFEVARGMIGAAIKAEMACVTAGLDPQRAAALEARVMARINQVQAPF